ncbi:WD40-repeat-containing domain protein [Syncephalis fuscata]|nr:WD40-repeat-containing domain protein [Syncephalis fuscata]
MVVSQDNQAESASLVPQLDGWRTAPAVKGANAVRSTQFLLPDDGHCLTSLATSNAGSLLAAGSAGRDTTIYFVQTPDPPEVREFSLISTVSCPGPVHSLAWSGHTLLAGSIDNTVHVYSIDHSRLHPGSSSASDAVDHVGQSIFRTSKLNKSANSSYLQTGRVHRVEFASTDDPIGGSSQFAFIAGQSVSIWDVNNLNTAIRSDKVSSDVIFSLAWHPQPACQLIALGGVDKSISLIDPRQQGKPVIWKSRGAHEDTIRDIAWHPYIPYWLASASDNNCIQFYDIRYSPRPLYAINEHYGSVNSIVWSNSHCDMLASASTDRRFRLWRLKSEKSEAGPREVSSELTIESTPLFDSSVVKVISSKIQPDIYYAMSNMGDIRSFSMSSDLLQMSTMHRYEERDYPVEYSIETSVYARDLDAGHRQVAAWIKRPGNDQRMQEAKTFLELLTPKPAIDPSAWTLSSSSSSNGRQAVNPAEAADGFPRELARRSWFLPPGFNLRLAKPPSKEAKKELDMMLVKINLRDYIQKGDVNTLLSLESTIISVLSADPRSLDSSLIKDMLKVIMKSDRIKGLEFGLSLVESRAARTSTLASVVHLLLFPTVFDNTHNNEDANAPQASPNDSIQSMDESSKRSSKRDERRIVQRQMEEVVSDHKQTAAMIRLEIEINKARQRDSNLTADHIAPIGRDQRTVAANTNRLYLNALVDLGHYDEYFKVAMQLIAEHARFDFARTLLHQLAMVVAPKYKQELETLTEAANEDPKSFALKDYRNHAIMCMRTITLPGSELPGLGRNLLSSYLADLIVGLYNILEIMVNERKDYSQAARESQQVIRTIKEIAGGSQNVPDEARRRLELLQTFTQI